MALGDGAREYIDRKQAGMHALLQNWAGQLEGYAKQYASWTDRTGHARQSLHGGVDMQGEQFVLYLSHGVGYGLYLETGTGIHGPRKAPYTIKAKNKKALYWPGANHPVKEVTHPGMAPRAIIVPTAEVHKKRIRQTVLDYWRD